MGWIAFLFRNSILPLLGVVVLFLPRRILRSDPFVSQRTQQAVSTLIFGLIPYYLILALYPDASQPALHVDILSWILSFFLCLPILFLVQRDLYPPLASDSAEGRRKLLAAYTNNPFVPYYRYPATILHGERYVHLKRGAAIFLQSWFPNGDLKYPNEAFQKYENSQNESSPPLVSEQPPLTVHNEVPAIIVFFHGYSDHGTGLFPDTARRFVDQGYGVYCHDHSGHGRSDGLFAFIPDFNILIDDAAQILALIRQAHPGKKIFVLSESMGGNVAFHVALRYRQLLEGIIFCAPMLSIQSSQKPPQWVISAFTFLCTIFPAAPILPGSDLLPYCLRDPDQLLRANAHPMRNHRRARLLSALNLSAACDATEKLMTELATPFLALHGEHDRVTDVNGSRKLFSQAKSTDKALKVYSDAYHALLVGEPKESKDVIFQEIFQWLEKRTP